MLTRAPARRGSNRVVRRELYSGGQFHHRLSFTAPDPGYLLSDRVKGRNAEDFKFQNLGLDPASSYSTSTHFARLMDSAKRAISMPLLAHHSSSFESALSL